MRAVQLIQQAILSRKPHQSLLKAYIRQHNPAFTFNQDGGLDKVHSSHQHQVAHASGATAVDAQSTVHQHHSSCLACSINEGKGLSEVLGDVVVVSVVGQKLNVLDVHALVWTAVVGSVSFVASTIDHMGYA